MGRSDDPTSDDAVLRYRYGPCKRFPVLNSPKGCARYVQWDKLNDAHAVKIHGQTLVELAERGGLSPGEIATNLTRSHFRDIVISDEAAVDLVNGIK